MFFLVLGCVNYLFIAYMLAFLQCSLIEYKTVYKMYLIKINIHLHVYLVNSYLFLSFFRKTSFFAK